VGKFGHLDVHAEHGSQCTFWWVLASEANTKSPSPENDDASHCAASILPRLGGSGIDRFAACVFGSTSSPARLSS
jgi:hypothetical protein